MHLRQRILHIQIETATLAITLFISLMPGAIPISIAIGIVVIVILTLSALAFDLIGLHNHAQKNRTKRDKIIRITLRKIMDSLSLIIASMLFAAPSPLF